MLPRGAVAAGHVWKRFKADRRRRLLRDELQRWGARLNGTGGRGWRWALRDATVLAEPGESVALLGSNGSGKTTLLKILARVMYPYAGEVQVVGRVGALIELRSGIHPDLSGRENVYLMGSLLGLRRNHVRSRFDEIVAFAELEDAIDRQVKFYSSGMQMRLGFAIAAFLEPDVLLVDEVLAVGDATFQQRCLDRMREILTNGTTLVFVSHDLAAVQAMCAKGVWLQDGTVAAEGPVDEVLGAYRRSLEELSETSWRSDDPIKVIKAEIRGADEGIVKSGRELRVGLVVEAAEQRNGTLYLGVSEGTATPIFLVERELSIKPGRTEIDCTIPFLPLPRGRFYLWAGLFHGGREVMPWRAIAGYEVAGPPLAPAPRGMLRLAPVHVESSWHVKRH